MNECFTRSSFSFIVYEMLEDYSKTLQVQRQLQLRIEAQGKYLKKIIEEQQRLSGVLSEAPVSDGIGPESENKTNPGTPAAISEPHFADKFRKERNPDKSISVDESSSSQHEPQTPDSDFHMTSQLLSPYERPVKKQCRSSDISVLESSSIPPF